MTLVLGEDGRVRVAGTETAATAAMLAVGSSAYSQRGDVERELGLTSEQLDVLIALSYEVGEWY